jgi:hypothetical protein
MKRIGSFVLLMTLILVLAGCAKDKDNQVEKDYSEFTYLPTLNHQSFQDKLNAGATFYVYIGRPDCGDSRQFNEEFETLFVDTKVNEVMYGLDEQEFYYFDISEIIDSTRNKDARVSYKESYGFYYTPSLVAYEDLDGDGVSEVKNIAEWTGNAGFYISDYMAFFYNNGLITPSESTVHEGESNFSE